MSDQDDNTPVDETGKGIFDEEYTGGATSTAGHGSTTGNEGNVGRTGYNNSTRGADGNTSSQDTSTTAGATASERYDDLTGANNDDLFAGDTVSEGERDADFAGSIGAAPEGASGEQIEPEIRDGAPTGGVGGVGDPGEAAREAYSGHGVFAGGGSNDPNAIENPPSE